MFGSDAKDQQFGFCESFSGQYSSTDVVVIEELPAGSCKAIMTPVVPLISAEDSSIGQLFSWQIHHPE